MQINATQALPSTSTTSTTLATARSQNAASFAMLLEAAQQKQDDVAASSAVSVGDLSGRVAKTGAKSAAEQLAEYANKSVDQRVRDAVLKDMGLTEEDLAAMDPEKRAAIEDEIAKRVRQALAGLTGGAQLAAQDADARVSGLAAALQPD